MHWFDLYTLCATHFVDCVCQSRSFDIIFACNLIANSRFFFFNPVCFLLKILIYSEINYYIYIFIKKKKLYRKKFRIFFKFENCLQRTLTIHNLSQIEYLFTIQRSFFREEITVPGFDRITWQAFSWRNSKSVISRVCLVGMHRFPNSITRITLSRKAVRCAPFREGRPRLSLSLRRCEASAIRLSPRTVCLSLEVGPHRVQHVACRHVLCNV